MCPFPQKFQLVTVRFQFQIKEERFQDAINTLNTIPESSTTRAGLSLLGHCYYQTQDFIEAANCYEHLLNLVPDVQEYRLYYAQSLFQAGLFEEAQKIIATGLDSPELKDKVLQLQSAIVYGNEDYTAAQSLLLQRQDGNGQEASTKNDEGCLLYQANMYEDALQRYVSALQAGGFNPHVAYNAALCHYRRKENSQALNYIAEIVERGIRNHPELGVGAQAETEGGARSVGNPPALAASGLAQAFNLKAAIEYQEGNGTFDKGDILGKDVHFNCNFLFVHSQRTVRGKL